MNKSALKKFTIPMRLELISMIKNKIDFLPSDAYKENLAVYNTNKVHIQLIEEVPYAW